MVAFFKYLVIGIVALLALKVALTVIGIGIALLTLAIPVAVVAALGYGVYRVLGGGSKSSRQISEADQKWLNG